MYIICKYVCNYVLDGPGCDCSENNCMSVYTRTDDIAGEPSNVRCQELDYFTCLYFIMVTISTVGYGINHKHTNPNIYLNTYDIS